MTTIHTTVTYGTSEANFSSIDYKP